MSSQCYNVIGILTNPTTGGMLILIKKRGNFNRPRSDTQWQWRAYSRRYKLLARMIDRTEKSEIGIVEIKKLPE